MFTFSEAFAVVKLGFACCLASIYQVKQMLVASHANMVMSALDPTSKVDHNWDDKDLISKLISELQIAKRIPSVAHPVAETATLDEEFTTENDITECEKPMPIHQESTCFAFSKKNDHDTKLQALIDEHEIFRTSQQELLRTAQTATQRAILERDAEKFCGEKFKISYEELRKTQVHSEMELKSEFERLQKDKHHLSTRIKDLESQLQAAQKVDDDARNEIAHLQDVVIAADSKLVDADTEISGLMSNLNDTNQTFARVMNQVFSLESRLQIANDAASAARRDAFHMKNKVATVNSKISVAEKKIESLQQDLNTANQSSSNTARLLAEITEDHSSLKQAFSDANYDCILTKHALENANDEIAFLKQELAAFKNDKLAKDSSHPSATVYDHTASTKSGLATEFEHESSKQRELTNTQSGLAALKQALMTIADEDLDMKGEPSPTTTKMQNTDINAQLTAAQLNLALTASNLTTNHGQIANIMSELTATKIEAAMHKEMAAATEKDHQATIRELEVARADLSAKESLLSAMHDVHATNFANYQKLVADKSRVEGHLAALTRSNMSLAQDLDASNRLREAAERAAANLRNDVSYYQIRLSAAAAASPSPSEKSFASGECEGHQQCAACVYHLRRSLRVSRAGEAAALEMVDAANMEQLRAYSALQDAQLGVGRASLPSATLPLVELEDSGTESKSESEEEDEGDGDDDDGSIDFILERSLGLDSHPMSPTRT
ncbi:hypothetical protein BS50DRAFT_665823 [Corynespora cassiicola Philippines]|uniref:Uncharacterized protein n=1 Tax=Corynespora cassiicola Philippines TaxID=1448308 RepID=A0A2T2NRX6_CORCC|nr:hypothetical protein BS50DRAFT_665823 [Corynespora cassiicola Philippines]